WALYRCGYCGGLSEFSSRCACRNRAALITGADVRRRPHVLFVWSWEAGWISLPKTATSTRKRVRPAIIDCCRSAAHEASLHKRLPHPCALLSGHPWPPTFLGGLSSPPPPDLTVAC